MLVELAYGGVFHLLRPSVVPCGKFCSSDVAVVWRGMGVWVRIRANAQVCIDATTTTTTFIVLLPVQALGRSKCYIPRIVIRIVDQKEIEKQSVINTQSHWLGDCKYVTKSALIIYYVIRAMNDGVRMDRG